MPKNVHSGELQKWIAANLGCQRRLERHAMMYFYPLQICVLVVSVLSSVQADIRNNGGHMSHEPALSPSLCGNGRTDEDVFFIPVFDFSYICPVFFHPFLNLMFVSVLVFIWILSLHLSHLLTVFVQNALCLHSGNYKLYSLLLVAKDTKNMKWTQINGSPASCPHAP